MLRFVVFLCAASVTWAALPFKVVDCNNSPNKLFRWSNPHIDHDPIEIPGNLTGSVDVEFLQPIDGHHYNISLVLAKKILFGWITLPCFEDPHVNVCTEDLCTLLSGRHYQNANHCPDEIFQSSPDFPCSCPIKPGTYRLNPTTVSIPHLNVALQMLAQGDYQAKVTIVDTRTNEQVACIAAQVSTHSASTSLIG